MSGLTWGKPMLVKGNVTLHRRAMSYGGARDQIEWLVSVNGNPVWHCYLKRDAVWRFNYCVEQEGQPA